MGHLIPPIIGCLLCIICPLVEIHIRQKHFHSGPFPRCSVYTSTHNSVINLSILFSAVDLQANL